MLDFGIKTEYKEWREESRYSTFRSRLILCSLMAINRKPQRQHTCYRLNCLCMVASNQEDDIPLARIHVVVLKEEHFVDSIFLEPTELDKQANSAGERALDDQILLASNLLVIRVYS